MGDILVIDGSMGEGGGQILRTSLAMASVLGKPVRIVNIRAKRKNPGLQRQHLVSVKAVAALASARVEGAQLGSKELTYYPGQLRGGSYSFNIGTAGSITLVFQAIMPLLFFIRDEVRISIRGGTDVPWSPPIDYVRFVILPQLRELGLDVDIVLKKRGHYPRGGGEVVIISRGRGHIEAVDKVYRGEIEYIEGLSHCVRLPRHVAERQARAAKEFLARKYPGIPVHIDLEYYEPSRDPHLGPGSGIVVWAKTEYSILGGDSLGARGKKAEVVGEEAARKLAEDLDTGKAFDRHLSDMIIPLAALSGEPSTIGGSKLTMHAYTNILVVRKFMPKIKAEFSEGGEIGRPFTLKLLPS